MGVVTVSASYGAGGSEIGPAVAAALGLPFVDRAVPASVARKLDVPLDQAERRDETTDRGLWRVISSMALVPEMAGAGPLAYNTFTDEHAFREKTEEVLHEIADSGGVVLGRAAAIVLAGRARCAARTARRPGGGADRAGRRPDRQAGGGDPPGAAVQRRRPGRVRAATSTGPTRPRPGTTTW